MRTEPHRLVFLDETGTILRQAQDEDDACARALRERRTPSLQSSLWPLEDPDDNRRFLNALLWMARSGGHWRDLPERLGDYETVKRRYDRWIEMGVLDAVLAALTREADREWLLIDSTIVRAHQHAAGARRQKGGRMPRALAAHAAA
jgi:transposase